jgi:arsenate reductase-like glutaredoxin family protein
MSESLTNDSGPLTTVWGPRLSSATKYYEAWEQKYVCRLLEDYYRGFQRPGLSLEDQRAFYTFNLIQSTIDIKLAGFSFQNIKFALTPRPSRSDFNFELAVASAQLKEDCLNTIIHNQKENFCAELEDAIIDSYFRFGVLEVGYSADWITNPNAGKPLYLTDLDPNAQNGEAGEPIIVKQPDQIPQNELIYFKRIPPARFRVGGVDGRYLHQCNWFGYYDFYYADDIRSSKVLQNTNKLQTVSARTTEWEYSDEYDELLKQGDLLKIWKIYDLRKKSCILYDEANDLILYEKPFGRIPVFDLRWIRERLTWYPIPPVFNWISAQNEMNESRQSMRSYRRRFVSQQYAIEGQIEQGEIDKYEEGRDGAVIKIKRAGAIGPIPKDPLTNVVEGAMVVGKDDFIAMSGTSSEAMGQADRVTATQTIEMSKRFGVREAREKIRVANWIERIAREALMTAQEKMVNGLWIKSANDPGESIMGEVQLNKEAWDYVLTQDLDDGIDYDINVQMTTMSPLDNDAEKTKFIEFVALLKRFPELALSPLLIRETAYRVGYRNEKVIRELQATSLLASLGQMTQQGQQSSQSQGPTGEATAEQIVNQQTPPTAEQVQNQIDTQLVQ